MKIIKHTFLVIVLCTSYHTVMAQSLSTMPVAKRDSILISIAKEAVLLYGPDYYREYKPPVISKGKSPEGKNVGKTYYVVTFLYDPMEETLDWNYAARVTIREDTGHPEFVDFGNGMGEVIPEGTDWRKGTSDPMPYQEAMPIPKYDPKTWEVLNKDEFIRKGWREMDNGQWEKVRPDIPPGKRKKEDK